VTVDVGEFLLTSVYILVINFRKVREKHGHFTRRPRYFFENTSLPPTPLRTVVSVVRLLWEEDVDIPVINFTAVLAVNKS
jgi:hypothetical protein